MTFASSHIQLHLEESKNSAYVFLSKGRTIHITEINYTRYHNDRRHAAGQIWYLFDDIHIIREESENFKKYFPLNKCKYEGIFSRSGLTTGIEKRYDFSLLWDQLPMIYSSYRRVSYQKLKQLKFLLFTAGRNDYLFPTL